jgi:uncharacterized protein (TIGR04255 family)
MGSTMKSVVDVPFGHSVPEVDLPRAPLVYVIAQARFERIASVSNESFVAGFQEAVRDVYPLMRKDQQAGILIGTDGRVVPGESSNITWRFDQDPEQWQLTLSPDAITLTTSRYTRRRDFIARLQHAITAAEKHLRVRFCERLGIRYIDRVTDEQLLARLPELVKPEVLGVACLPLGESDTEQIHCFSDTVYRMVDNVDLHARWGILPAKATFDPGIEASDVQSWILDLDMYTTRQETFDPGALTAKAEVMCERIYRFFRWVVTDEFLMAHGGEL